MLLTFYTKHVSTVIRSAEQPQGPTEHRTNERLSLRHTVIRMKNNATYAIFTMPSCLPVIKNHLSKQQISEGMVVVYEYMLRTLLSMGV